MEMLTTVEAQLPPNSVRGNYAFVRRTMTEKLCVEELRPKTSPIAQATEGEGHRITARRGKLKRSIKKALTFALRSPTV